MAFDKALASYLTGATESQLTTWARNGLLVPEIRDGRRRLYSFRDLLALRTMAKLRSKVSLQKIRRAFDTMSELELTDHPSHYELVAHEDSIRLVERSSAIGHVVTDLVRNRTQTVLVSLDDVMAPFRNFRGDQVVDFRRPRPHLEVREGRMGGIPTAEGTRVTFDSIARLLEGGDIAPERVADFYPTVTLEGALDAVDFARHVHPDGRVVA